MSMNQSMKNITKVSDNLSCFLMRKKAIIMVKNYRDKQRIDNNKEVYLQKFKNVLKNNKFCAGYCENPINCTCLINNSN